MKTHIGPIYLILGCMAFAAVTIATAEPRAHASATVKATPAAMAYSFQATSPGMAMPTRLIVLGGADKALEAEVQRKVEDALAQARGRKRAG